MRGKRRGANVSEPVCKGNVWEREEMAALYARPRRPPSLAATRMLVLSSMRHGLLLQACAMAYGAEGVASDVPPALFPLVATTARHPGTREGVWRLPASRARALFCALNQAVGVAECGPHVHAVPSSSSIEEDADMHAGRRCKSSKHGQAQGMLVIHSSRPRNRLPCA